jgi:hypothetical protein
MDTLTKVHLDGKEAAANPFRATTLDLSSDNFLFIAATCVLSADVSSLNLKKDSCGSQDQFDFIF